MTDVLEIEPGKRKNTSRRKDIECVERALFECRHYYLIDKFLAPEIDRYECIL